MTKADVSPLYIASRLSRMAGKTKPLNKKELQINTNVKGDKVLDIVPHEIEPHSTSSDGGSLRRSPFLPQVEGTPSLGTTSISYTPGTEKIEKNENEKKKRKKGQRELEKSAAPEKELTLFAMRLVVLEKIASGVGTMGFIWATVVILGGYAITMKEVDFWFVTVILLTEGARIFSRSHELEWQHQDVGAMISFKDRAKVASFAAYKRGSEALLRSTRKVRTVVSTLVSPGKENIAREFALASPHEPLNYNRHPLMKRTWSSSKVPMLPGMTWFFQAKNVSRLFYWMQLVSAISSIVLSVIRLQSQKFTRPDEEGSETNHTAALNVFYSLAVFEALVFLIERSYWQWKISHEKILIKVNEMCGLQPDSLYTMRCFFYDVYSKCLSGSVFEGLKVDLLDYSITMVQSDFVIEQLGGLRLLAVFGSKSEFSENTLRRIGTTQGVVERLIDMVTWKNPDEQELRKSAALVLCQLAKFNRNCVRVTAIPGSIEGIFTLLVPDAQDRQKFSHDHTRHDGSDSIDPKQIQFHILGLRILKNLAKDRFNCGRIGTTRGLLARLVSFISIDSVTLRNAEEPEGKIKLVNKSLELLRLLATASGFSGKQLRDDIAKLVFTVRNLRNIIEYGEAHMVLQQRALNILSSLALDDDIREYLGRAGGVIRNLFRLFLKDNVTEDGNELRLAKTAGETITLLALQSEKNCLRMLRMKLKQGDNETDVIPSLTAMLGHWELGHIAARILRSFCVYTNFADKERILPCTPQMIRQIMEHRGKIQESAMGMAACTIELMSMEELEGMFSEEVTKYALVKKLGAVLERHPTPSTELPRIRRFTLELMIALADKDSFFVTEFQSQSFESHLEMVLDTSSDLENFATFSGSVGVTKHRKTIEELVETAISKLQLHEKIFHPSSIQHHT